MSHEGEIYRAKLESARNGALDAYMDARPAIACTTHNKKLFEAGFDRAWELLQKEIKK